MDLINNSIWIFDYCLIDKQEKLNEFINLNIGKATLVYEKYLNKFFNIIKNSNYNHKGLHIKHYFIKKEEYIKVIQDFINNKKNKMSKI